MILKIFLYSAIIFAVLITEYSYNWFNPTTVNTLLVLLCFFIIYVFLLYIEIIFRKNKRENFESVRKKVFVFSFWIGVVWGIMLSFLDGIPRIYNLLTFILLITNYVMMGLIFGLIGRVLLGKLWNRISRRETI
jgi:quinol-cytochrome oxidoreductase complex cytochrome b subunit